jgi:hypothetical protein
VTAISDRVAVKALIVDTLEAAFAAQTSNPDLRNVLVHYGDPGEAITDQFVLLGTVEGNVTPDVFGPAGSGDEFTIACGIDVTGFATELEADQRAQHILNELNSALFQSRFAQSLGARVFPASQDGPNGVPPADGNPAGSAVELTIGVSINVRGS